MNPTVLILLLLLVLIGGGITYAVVMTRCTNVSDKNASAWNTDCTIKSCASGYTLQDNACVLSTCPDKASIHAQDLNTDCTIKSCLSGYDLNNTNSCVPTKCVNVSDPNASAWNDDCSIKSCKPNYTLKNGTCVQVVYTYPMVSGTIGSSAPFNCPGAPGVLNNGTWCQFKSITDAQNYCNSNSNCAGFSQQVQSKTSNPAYQVTTVAQLKPVTNKDWNWYPKTPGSSSS